MVKVFRMSTDENAFQNAQAFRQEMEAKGYQTCLSNDGLGTVWFVAFWR